MHHLLRVKVTHLPCAALGPRMRLSTTGIIYSQAGNEAMNIVCSLCFCNSHQAFAAKMSGRATLAAPMVKRVIKWAKSFGYKIAKNNSEDIIAYHQLRNTKPNSHKHAYINSLLPMNTRSSQSRLRVPCRLAVWLRRQFLRRGLDTLP